jgi:hypothetical protein
MKIQTLCNATLAAAALVLLTCGAQAQFGGYSGGFVASPIISAGGMPGTAVVPGGAQSLYNPAMGFYGPYGYSGNPGYAYNGYDYNPYGAYGPASYNGYYGYNGYNGYGYDNNAYLNAGAPVNAYGVPDYNYGAPAYNYGPPMNRAAAYYRSNAIPRTNDAISAVRQAGNRIQISWQGTPGLVQNITFSLLDQNRRPINQQLITSLPARATFTRTKNAAFYQVVVQYVNGTTTSVTSPL